MELWKSGCIGRFQVQLQSDLWSRWSIRPGWGWGVLIRETNDFWKMNQGGFVFSFPPPGNSTCWSQHSSQPRRGTGQKPSEVCLFKLLKLLIKKYYNPVLTELMSEIISSSLNQTYLSTVWERVLPATLDSLCPNMLCTRELVLPDHCTHPQTENQSDQSKAMTWAYADCWLAGSWVTD